MERPCFVYHFGDFDPSGQDAARAIEKGLRQHAKGAEIHFERIAVTQRQIDEWNLPTRPTKQSDSRAKKFGPVSVELDAIDPNQLRALVDEVIARHLPPEQYKVLIEAEKSERTLFQGLAGLVKQLGGRKAPEAAAHHDRNGNSDAVFHPLKTKKRLNNPPDNQPWVWSTHEMLESGAMRSLTDNGRRILDRIKLEHMAHGGLENGRLKCTWLDFDKYGVSPRLINKSISEAVAVGLLAIEQPGRKVHGKDIGVPAQYRLTYLPVSDAGSFCPPTNEWKRFGSNARAAKAAIMASERKSGNGKSKCKFQPWPMPEAKPTSHGGGTAYYTCCQYL